MHNKIRNALHCLALLSVIAFFSSLTTLAWIGYRSRHSASEALTHGMSPVMASVVATVSGDPKATTPEGRLPLRDAVLGQVAQIRKDLFVEVRQWRETSDRQLTAIQTTATNLGGKLDPVLGSTKVLLDHADGLVDPAKLVLSNSAALVKDGQESLDDLYPDVNALVQTANVTAVGIAKTSEAVAKAAPKIEAASEAVADLTKKEAEEFAKPKTLKQKLMFWLELVPRLGIKLL